MRAPRRARTPRLMLAGIVTIAVVAAVAHGLAGPSGAEADGAGRAALQLASPEPQAAPDQPSPVPAVEPVAPDAPAAPAAPVTTPASTPDVTTPPVETDLDQDAVDVISDTLAAVVDIAPDPDGEVDVPAGAPVRGALVSELEAELLEFAAEGWTRSGSFRVDHVAVKAHVTDTVPETLTVSACIDSSDVVVRRADGTRQPPNAETRATSIFLLERHDDGWWVAGRAFPDNPTC